MLKNFFAIISAAGLLFLSSVLPTGKSVISINGKSGGVFSESETAFLCDGFSKSFPENYDYSSLVKSLGGKLVAKEILKDSINYYYYSERLPKREVLKGKAVNLHVSAGKNRVIIGTPIIYCGY